MKKLTQSGFYHTCALHGLFGKLFYRLSKDAEEQTRKDSSGRMLAAATFSLLMSVLLDSASAGSCTCACCVGYPCVATVPGTFSASSSSDCNTAACKSKYPSVCPASSSVGSAFSSASTYTPSNDGTSLVTRTSVNSQCGVPPDSCFYKCSACYTVVISGTAFTMTPGSVSGCTCFTGTGTIPLDYTGGNLVANFPDGISVAVSSTVCTATMQTMVNGNSCTGTYTTTKINGNSICPSGAATCPAPMKCDSQSACGRACCGEDNPQCVNMGALSFSTINGVRSCSLKGVDCSRCEKENVVAQLPATIKCDSQSACGRACCGEDNPECINMGALAFSTVNGVRSCSLKGTDCSRCEKEVPIVSVVNRPSSASFFKPTAGLVMAGLIITLGLSVWRVERFGVIVVATTVH